MAWRMDSDAQASADAIVCQITVSGSDPTADTWDWRSSSQLVGSIVEELDRVSHQRWAGRINWTWHRREKVFYARLEKKLSAADYTRVCAALFEARAFAQDASYVLRQPTRIPDDLRAMAHASR